MPSIDDDILDYMAGERGAIFRGTLVEELVRLHSILPDAWADCNETDLQMAIDRLLKAGRIEQDTGRLLRLVPEPPQQEAKQIQSGLFD